MLAGIAVDAVQRRLFVISTAGELWSIAFYGASCVGTWEKVGDAATFMAPTSACISLASSKLQRIEVALRDDQGRIWENFWVPQSGWNSDHGWFLLTDAIDAAPSDPLALLSRVEGVLELVVRASTGTINWPGGPNAHCIWPIRGVHRSRTVRRYTPW